MKRIVALLFCLSAVAADRIAISTNTTPVVVTRGVTDATAIYNTSDATLPAIELVTRFKQVKDGKPETVTITFTKDMLDRLPDTVTNNSGAVVANAFKNGMLIRWTNINLIPDHFYWSWSVNKDLPFYAMTPTNSPSE